MTLPESITVLIFSGGMLLLGIVGLVRGKLDVGNETETLWEITGFRAKLFSSLLVVSGILLLVNPSYGFGLFLLTMIGLLIFRG